VLEGARRSGADLAIIDTPAKSSDASIAAALVLIPVRAQMFDIETLGAVQDILKLARNPAAVVVVNAAPIQGSGHLDTIEAAKALGFAACPVVLFHRAAHGDATHVGQTATEHAPGQQGRR
jgi:chromosome partitioning protein